MSESTGYIYEKFRAGLEGLATHPGEIKERLRDAYSGQIMRGDNPGNDVPAELRERIHAFHERMTLVKDHTETVGHIHTTIAAMTEMDAVDLARQVAEIEAELRDLGGYEA